MESPIAVANYFIQKSFDTGEEMTPMKVLKLVYIAHGWNLGIKSEPLISEAVQAWQYGPVIETVYHKFKDYGNKQITSLGSNFGFGITTPVIQDKKNESILDKVWDVYKKYNGLQLSTLTHQSGTPWDIIWNQESGAHRKSAIIPNDLIQAHYKMKIQNNGAAA